MKGKSLILTLVIMFLISLSGTVLAAENLTGFYGIPWGTDRATTMQILKDYGYTSIKEVSNEDNSMQVLSIHGDFNDLVGRINFYFYKNELYSGMVTSDVTLDNCQQPIPIWEKMVVGLTNKYGQPTRRVFYLPSWCDKYSNLAPGAIASGQGEAQAVWKFYQNNKVIGMIGCSISKDMSINVLYNDEVRNATVYEILNQQKSKEAQVKRSRL
jgi:hypothetical protein